LGLSGSVGTRTCRECEEKNLIKVITVKFGKGSPKYPILLPDGYKALGQQEPKFRRKGENHESFLYLNFILQHFAAFNPALQANMAGKFIDIVIRLDQLTLAIELEMRKKTVEINIIKDFSISKVNYVTVVSPSKTVHEKIVQIVSEMAPDIKSRTYPWFIGDLLSTDPKEFIDAILQ
jgi:hypothetical protein